MGSGFQVRVARSVGELPASAWDALVGHEPDAAGPFVRHAFLSALEESGSAAPRTGWSPRHLTLWRGGRLVAAAPAWLRGDSDGDFSRDFGWAAAAERARLRYYPKLVLGVPFTPATGRRVLVTSSESRGPAVAALAAAARELAREEGAGTVQALFLREDEVAELEAAGMVRRLDFQYHWRNAGYRSFEDFLARFPSKKRHMIRRERAAPDEQGIAIRSVRGDELAADPRRWAAEVFELHRRAVDRMFWGMRWVNLDFYRRVLAGMPDAVEVVEARREGRLVGAAFNLSSRTHLYGRYWGCSEDHPFLHFNVCLYHSVDECIRRAVQVFEGGAGGEHKLARGFEPAETWSAHLFLDPRLDAALRRHLAQEVRERTEAIARWREASPLFKRDPRG